MNVLGTARYVFSATVEMVSTEHRDMKYLVSGMGRLIQPKAGGVLLGPELCLTPVRCYGRILPRSKNYQYFSGLSKQQL